MYVEVGFMEALLVEWPVYRVKQYDPGCKHCKEALVVLFFLTALLDHLADFDSLVFSNFEFHELVTGLLKLDWGRDDEVDGLTQVDQIFVCFILDDLSLDNFRGLLCFFFLVGFWGFRCSKYFLLELSPFLLVSEELRVFFEKVELILLIEILVVKFYLNGDSVFIMNQVKLVWDPFVAFKFWLSDRK